MLTAMHPQPLVRRAATFVTVTLLAIGSSGCSGGQKSDPPNNRVTSTAGQTTTTAAAIDVDVALGTTALRGPGANHADPPPLTEDVATDVLTTVDRYVQRALVSPLRGDEFDPSGLLALAAAARLVPRSHDRTVVTSEGLPEVETASIRLAPVDLVGLTEGFGSIPLVSARIDFEAKLETAEGPLDIHHFGELVLAYTDGWHVVGYEMIVVRDDGHSASTTTATASPGSDTTSEGAP
jgi:hypothetical protein